MPPLSLLTNDVNIENKKYILREATINSEEIAIGYGEMIGVAIDFFIIALTIFIVVKSIVKFKNKAEDPQNKDISTPKDIELLNTIKQLMEEQNELLRNQNK